MKISILCSDPNHPVNAFLYSWITLQSSIHEVQLVRKKSELKSGDFLFLISCSEIIEKIVRDKFKFTLLLHASDLPKGRGWSPHIWEIINGAEQLTLCLLEAEDKVDSGKIWLRRTLHIPSHAIYNEINKIIFNAEVDFIDYAINNFQLITPIDQAILLHNNHYPKRTPIDSQIDPNISILDQFNLLRVCDPERFPAFFIYKGYRFILKLEKINE